MVAYILLSLAIGFLVGAIASPFIIYYLIGHYERKDNENKTNQ